MRLDRHCILARIHYWSPDWGNNNLVYNEEEKMTDYPTMAQVKMRNGDLAWLPARKALLLSLTKQADIVKNPPFKWDDDLEKDDWQRIFEKTYELMQSVPVVRYGLNKERLNEAEKEMLEVAIRPILSAHITWMSKDLLIEKIDDGYPKFRSVADKERRLRSIVQKGWLLKENRPDTVYYHLP